MARPLTKPGKHGPLYCYEITYRDVSGDPTFKQRLWAYSLRHAHERFYEAPDADGWEAVSAQVVPEQGPIGLRPVHRLL